MTKRSIWIAAASAILGALLALHAQQAGQQQQNTAGASGRYQLHSVTPAQGPTQILRIDTETGATVQVIQGANGFLVWRPVSEK